MPIKKQVVIACDSCGSNVTYTWGREWNTNIAVSMARAKGWQVGKKSVYCPVHRTTKAKRG